MEYPKLFLNKVIEENDGSAFTRYNITKDDMHSDVDRKTFEFIEEYSEQNGGDIPSYATVASEVEGFEYIPEVSDSFRWLGAQIKDYTAKREIIGWFETGEFERRLNEMGGKEFIEKYLIPQVESVNIRTSVREEVGTDVKRDSDKFLEEYERRKAGESFRVWKSRFPAIGEYMSGNLYVVYGKSGRGKSIITLEDALYAAIQGASVLIWSLEMPWFELMVRAYVSLSEEIGITSTSTEDVGIEALKGLNIDLTAGFDAHDLQRGQLSEDFEKAFKTFVQGLNTFVEGNIVVRSVDDEGFTDRSIRAIYADIDKTQADYVVIDPFYYLDYEKNTSRTTGGDAANTSSKLRALCGRKDVVVIAITQAEETKEDEDEDGIREIVLPKREDVTKTKQLLQDAYQLIGVDTNWREGRGLVGVMKGRSGGEGNVTEFMYIPQIGVVKPLELGEEALNGFDF